MNRLCEIGSPVLAAEILSRLDQESIPAEVTHNIGSAIFHPANRDRSQSTSVIWILDAEDLPRARELAEEARSILIESEHCLHCGYDLQGSVGEGNCPECGGRVKPPEEDSESCGTCGEENPVGFEICWHCGKTISDQPEPRGPDLRSSIRPRCANCDEVLDLGIRACQACGSTVMPSVGPNSSNRVISSVILWVLVLLGFIIVIAIGSTL